MNITGHCVKITLMLAATLICLTLMAPGSRASDDQKLQLGIRVASEELSGDTHWSKEPLSTGMHSSQSPGYGIALMYSDLRHQHGYRLSLELDYASWNKAATTQLCAGFDYLINISSTKLKPYAGVRAGIINFDDDYTDKNTNEPGFGAQAGMLYPLGLSWVGSPELEIYGRYLQTDASNKRTVAGQNNTVEIDSVTSYGIGLNWGF